MSAEGHLPAAVIARSDRSTIASGKRLGGPWSGMIAVLGLKAGIVDDMRSSVWVVHDLVNGIEPWDEVEDQHRADTLRWLELTDDVFRRVKPATPDRHLVSYVVLVDALDGSTLLVDHIKSGLGFRLVGTSSRTSTRPTPRAEKRQRSWASCRSSPLVRPGPCS